MRIPVPTSRLSVPSDPRAGLVSSEVAEQRVRYGANVVTEIPPQTWAQRVRETAMDPMLWFLVVTSGIYLLLGEWVEGVVLLLAVVPLTGMDALLHYRTRASTEGLASRLASRATVVRDGLEQQVPAHEVVVGDLLKLAPGEFVAADGLLLEVDGLQVEQSSLTGEAYPVRKRALASLPVGADIVPVEDVHWAFAGTRVLAGSAAVRVVDTGEQTLYGQIVHSAQVGAREHTPLQAAISQLVAALAAVAVLLCVILALVRWHQGHGWVDALVSAATLAVAALPEEFPVAFTFFLGVGVYRLARRQALVRRAVSVENIGRITTICADKTGTMTEGRLSVSSLAPAADGSPEELLRAAVLASRAESGDPLDTALLEEAARRGVGGGPSERLALFPFTEDRRRETAVWRDGEACLVATKGTPELVLAMCGLTPEEQHAWLEEVERFAAEGRKPIACATQRFPNESWRGGEPTEHFRLAGVVYCEDPVREGVGDALRTCGTAGIHTVMVTGDHPATALAIARAIGLGGASPRCVLGEALESHLASGAPPGDLDVVARALPGQKLALVRALQQAGERVAVTGDGVNDVPALQAADVGVAMGERGTRSAREVAAIVLLDDNFRTLVGAIAEGRQLFENLRSCFEYLLVVHIPLVFTAAFIPLAGYPLLYLPIHIVWLELLIHPTALLAFQDHADSDGLARVPATRKVRFFSVRDWVVVTVTGSLATAVVTSGYLYSLAESGQEEHGRAMALVTLVLSYAAVAALLSGLRTPAARVVVAASVVLTAVLVQLPPLARVLHVVPLHLEDWLRALAGAGVVMLPLVMDRALGAGFTKPGVGKQNTLPPRRSGQSGGG